MVFSFLGFLFIFHVFFLQIFNTYADSSTNVSFNEGFNPLYGFSNVKPYDNGESVTISLDEYTSSGFVSKELYNYGYFTASIKLPSNIYTAGLVVTFYTSNNQKFPSNHDEIDFEFLGYNIGENWTLQTNFYGNGSSTRGREERYSLWFDPSQDFHRYSILWIDNLIVYYVEDVPIRVVERVGNIGGDYPSKPMNLYGTIWNGSDWATDGGRYKLNLTYSPFVANYSEFVLDGCPVDPINLSPNCGENPEFPNIPKSITFEQRKQMEEFRKMYLTYSYCNDRSRYPVPLPECTSDDSENIVGSESLSGGD